jgi:hypothetical protein
MTSGDPREVEQRVQWEIEETLTEHGLNFTRYEGAHGGLPGLIVELPGERKLITNTLLSIGEHSVRVESFVCRRPDENHEAVYRFLLKRNRRLYGVAYTLDNIGDIYLIGRIALDIVNNDEIDRVLGQVLEAVDNDFNTLLELGFASSIRKEWAWRLARGESLKNLKAFEHLIRDDDNDRDPNDAGEPPNGAAST